MIGKFITFEGIDGSGKSTQIKMLKNELVSLGVKFSIYREPGGTELSEKIREILLNRTHIEIMDTAESLLFAAARSQLVRDKIKPALESGEIVICDRFIDSTIAYQGYGRGLDIKSLETINHLATSGITPDITFILDINPDIAANRITSEPADRMEKSGSSFFNKIRQGYIKIKDQDSYRCKVIDADRPPIDVFNEIKDIILKRFQEVVICN